MFLKFLYLIVLTSFNFFTVNQSSNANTLDFKASSEQKRIVLSIDKASIIYKIYSWKAIVADEISKTCMFVTDIDDTLICSKKHYFTSDQDCDLIESEAKNLIEMLFQKGVPTIACTACYGDRQFVKKRANRLRDLGIKLCLPKYFIKENFDKALKSWAEREEPFLFRFFIRRLLRKEHPHRPMFFDNILITDHLNLKGPMLLTCLEQACQKQFFPKTIILVDDQLHNHHLMKKVCVEKGLNFVGYWYLGSPRLAKRAQS